MVAPRFACHFPVAGGCCERFTDGSRELPGRSVRRPEESGSPSRTMLGIPPTVDPIAGNPKAAASQKA